MKKTAIGINGFERIGRTLFRSLDTHEHLQVVAINDEDTIVVDGNAIALLNQKKPKNIDWAAYDVAIVVECTGKFKTKEQLNHHLKNGAKRVILSAPPADDDIKMVVYGINENTITEEDKIISNVSCTTNNAAPMIQIINDLCGIEQAYITTIHSYTTDQSLHNQPHRDLRRVRAASQSIVTTTTGAAKALIKIFPELIEVIGGCGIRDPVANGSLTDITLSAKKPTIIQEIMVTFKRISTSELKNILFYTQDPIVSVDINNSCYSCTFDSQVTSILGKMAKIIGWNDNETGYSSRIIDLMVSKKYV